MICGLRAVPVAVAAEQQMPVDSQSPEEIKELTFSERKFMEKTTNGLPHKLSLELISVLVKESKSLFIQVLTGVPD